jgi:hypothetical protein
VNKIMRRGWARTSMSVALRHAAGRDVDREYSSERCTVVRFKDGTAVAAESECRGPYSDVTPDLDWEPPRFAVRLEGDDLYPPWWR